MNDETITLTGPVTIFTIPGFARGQGRPRFTRCGKHGRAYKDKKDIEREALIRLSYTQAEPDLPPYPGPIRLHVLALYTPPQSWHQKKKNAPGHKTSKPDLDNVVKSIKDGLNKVAWVDDAQVVQLAAVKQYSDYDQVVVKIIRL